jgi:hypothetical protein
MQCDASAWTCVATNSSFIHPVFVRDGLDAGCKLRGQEVHGSGLYWRDRLGTSDLGENEAVADGYFEGTSVFGWGSH